MACKARGGEATPLSAVVAGAKPQRLKGFGFWLGLCFGVLRDPYKSKKKRRLFFTHLRDTYVKPKALH